MAADIAPRGKRISLRLEHGARIAAVVSSRSSAARRKAPDTHGFFGDRGPVPHCRTIELAGANATRHARHFGMVPADRGGRRKRYDRARPLVRSHTSA